MASAASSTQDPMLQSENLRIKAQAAHKDGDLAGAIDMYGRALMIRTDALRKAGKSGGKDADTEADDEDGDRLYPECADLYFEYGQLLFENSRNQNDILGGPIGAAGGGDAASECEDDDEDAEDGEDGAGAGAGGSSSAADAVGATTVLAGGRGSGLSLPGLGMAAGGSGGGPVPGADMASALVAALKNAQRQSEMEAENEDSDLQLAWEMLESARLMFKAAGSPCDERLADVLLTLGEVAMEDEQFDSAVKDLAECASIRKRVLAPTSRVLAEAYFTLGMALQLASRQAEAHAQFVEAANVIEACMRSEKEKDKDKDKYNQSDLAAVLDDLKMKIQETAAADASGSILPGAAAAAVVPPPVPSHFAPPKPGGGAPVHVLGVRRAPSAGDKGKAAADDDGAPVKKQKT